MTSTAQFWRAYECRNGYRYDPAYEGDQRLDALENRVALAEDRLEILCELFVEHRCDLGGLTGAQLA